MDQGDTSFGSDQYGLVWGYLLAEGEASRPVALGAPRSSATSGPAHATDLLAADPDLNGRLTDWLVQRLAGTTARSR